MLLSNTFRLKYLSGGKILLNSITEADNIKIIYFFHGNANKVNFEISFIKIDDL